MLAVHAISGQWEEAGLLEPTRINGIHHRTPGGAHMAHADLDSKLHGPMMPVVAPCSQLEVDATASMATAQLLTKQVGELQAEVLSLRTQLSVVTQQQVANGSTLAPVVAAAGSPSIDHNGGGLDAFGSLAAADTAVAAAVSGSGPCVPTGELEARVPPSAYTKAAHRRFSYLK